MKLHASGKLRAFRNQLVCGALNERQQSAALALGWALNFILGMILAAVKLFGSCAPFGIAAAARIGDGLSGLFCSFGAACGYLAAFGNFEGVAHDGGVAEFFHKRHGELLEGVA